MDIEVGETEEKALREIWDCFGVLVSFVITQLGRESGLALARGLTAGQLTATWTLVPGRALCEISRRGGEVIYRFEFVHTPSRFTFVELGGGAAN